MALALAVAAVIAPADPSRYCLASDLSHRSGEPGLEGDPNEEATTVGGACEIRREGGASCCVCRFCSDVDCILSLSTGVLLRVVTGAGLFARLGGGLLLLPRLKLVLYCCPFSPLKLVLECCPFSPPVAFTFG